MDSQILITLRRSLIGAVVLLDRHLGLPPTFPDKEERRLLSIIRKGQIDLKAIRQFISEQLT